MNSGPSNIQELVHMVFAQDPKPPLSYTIDLSKVHGITPFQFLMNILILGAQTLYGNDITPDKISEKQFNILKEYIASIGFDVKYNYNMDENKKPISINIWFEQYMDKKDCHGRTIY